MVSYQALRSCLLAAVAILILATLAWASPQQIILYAFTGGTDGRNPYGLLTFDAAGNIYGTASGGGDYGHGVVFQLTPDAGGWNYSVLYGFRGTPDGDSPLGQVVFDPAGNIYGTTLAGGLYNCGTVYKLSPYYGRWSETVLYNFACYGKTGSNPQSGLALDAEGSLYGTTMWGGTPTGCFNQGCGTVFKLKPMAGKPWKLSLLHSFQGKNDGGNPQAGITLDAAGNVYGTAMGFGSKGFGTAYRLSYGPHNKIQAVFGLLHTFGSVYDGANPAGGLVFDATGNAYGSTLSGGGSDGSSNGTIYQLIPTPHGRWKFDLLYTVTGDYTGGVQQNLVLDANGSLYGTGGVGQEVVDGDGLFELSPMLSGAWNWDVVYDFPTPANGAWPQGVILDSNGHFYGTANGGGPYNSGVVFEVVP